MIIQCPSCSQRISNRNTVCPHCEFDLGGSGEGLSYDQAQARRAREGRYRLAMHSYGALALTTLGAVWSWVASEQMSRAPGFWPTATVAAGGLWYVVVRVLMLLNRLKRSDDS